MANGNISQISLPNGAVYDIEDSTARQMQLTATYTAATYNLALEFDAPDNADNEEF